MALYIISIWWLQNSYLLPRISVELQSYILLPTQYLHLGAISTCPIQFSSVQLLSHVRLSAAPWIAACQAPFSITNSQSSLKLMSIELVMPSSHLILCCLLLLLPPIPPSPALESFPMSQLFAWGGQSNTASALASFLPRKSQCWSNPLNLFLIPTI